MDDGLLSGNKKALIDLAPAGLEAESSDAFAGSQGKLNIVVGQWLLSPNLGHVQRERAPLGVD